MFQMVSSGAHTLLRADKRGEALTGIVERSLADMMQEHTASDRSRWQDSIIAALAQIKAAGVSDTVPSAIEFAGAAVKLHARPAAASILPKVDVVCQLLASAQAPAAAAADGAEQKQQQQQQQQQQTAAPPGASSAALKKGSKTGVVCRNWAATASCRFGSGCHYKDSHVSGGSAASEQPCAAAAAAVDCKEAAAAAASDAEGSDTAGAHPHLHVMT